MGPEQYIYHNTLERGHRPCLHPLRHARQRRHAVGDTPQGAAARRGLGDERHVLRRPFAEQAPDAHVRVRDAAAHRVRPPTACAWPTAAALARQACQTGLNLGKPARQLGAWGGEGRYAWGEGGW